MRVTVNGFVFACLAIAGLGVDQRRWYRRIPSRLLGQPGYSPASAAHRWQSRCGGTKSFGFVAANEERLRRFFSGAGSEAILPTNRGESPCLYYYSGTPTLVLQNQKRARCALLRPAPNGLQRKGADGIGACKTRRSH